MTMHDMTTLQAAYWIGRQPTSSLTGDAAHLYIEFEGREIDTVRLTQAVHTVFCQHEMLRLTVSEQGQWRVSDLSDWHQLFLIDWREKNAAECERDGAALRKQKMHQKLALNQGQGAEFTLTLLPDNGFRLHVDIDMIAADAPSFRIIIEDLVRAYHGSSPQEKPPSFSGYLTQSVTDDQQALIARDRRYWQGILDDIAPAPQLPEHKAAGSQPFLHTERLAAQLDASQREKLTALATHHHISLTDLSLSLFNLVLANALNQPSLRINVPLFVRPQAFSHTVGDFANLTLFSAHCSSTASILTHCQQTQHQLIACLEHRHYSGVNVMRDLSRRQGCLQTSPVVFTSGWNLDGDLYSAQVHDTLGDMIWASSQGAHVLLDAQIVPYNSGVLINWDVRVDSVPLAFYRALFERYVDLLSDIAEHPETLLQPYAAKPTISPAKEKRHSEQPLTRLQQAYLVGRSEHLALGGVAMQDFRVYRGEVDLALLQTRLASMVQTLPVLRTRIDESALTQWVSDEALVNLTHCDWRDLSRTQARQKADQLIEQVSHYRHDLSLSPWKVWVVSLPKEAEDVEDCTAFSHMVLTSFDALISDGHSISYILARMFEVTPQPLIMPSVLMVGNPSDEQRGIAQDYWQKKLSHVTEPMALPWRQPLNTIYQPSYARETITLSREEARALFKLAAEARLFPNSLLTTLVMQTVAVWCPQSALCIGLPVSPFQTGQLSNQSSFLVLNYSLESQDFQHQALGVQRDIAEGMAHLAFSGVDLNRLLLSQLPSQTIPLPIVVTNGLGWETLPKHHSIQEYDGLTQTPQIAIDFRFTYDAQKNLHMSADYVTQALGVEQVRAWLESWKRAALGMIARQSLQWYSREALDLSHYRFNDTPPTAAPFPFLVTLAERLFGQPQDRTALICKERCWSYRQLGQQVSGIIAQLHARGMTSGDVVAICLPRSAEHVMVTLSCALAGLVWVPIDAASPPERKAYLLAHCQPSLVVTIVKTLEFKGRNHSVTLNELMQPAQQRANLLDEQTLSRRSDSEEPAYYLYTSGTTGQPKCVVLTNKATSNVLYQTLAKWQVNESDVLMSVTPFHHDMSVFDVLGSLCAGASLVIPPPQAEKDALQWNELVDRHRVTLWCSVPAILEMLLACQSESQGKSLRLIAQGGDYIKPQTIKTLRERLPLARLFSLGGPTETTIWSIWHELVDDDINLIPYGEPLPGNQYYLINQAHQHCPQGVIGRMVICGVNLSLGYLMDGELAQHDFIEITTPEGERVRAFKTGDLGYYRDDGCLIFSGRVNGYVKVRGIRISLPDVEKVLLNATKVRDLAVIDYVDSFTGDTELALFYVSEREPFSVTQWREMIHHCLPASHMPQRFIALEHFPLSANGKKDKRALLAQLTSIKDQHLEEVVEEERYQRSRDARLASKTQPWQVILGVYQQVLGERATTLTEHSAFIQAGLRPSHIKSIATQLSQMFNKPVDARLLLTCKNVEQVSKLLESS
ncbi:amino acid adenylation domain-containing protein [Vibrio fujianensis]|uniref:amino acid adenylation domain-containing protein n=1 Tax=Vibrio fujianensis TaxID=1974215 RepID=UPI001FE876C8|nr:amino acid adenylation domain-containing protein [Vibrio fujianensis]